LKEVSIADEEQEQTEVNATPAAVAHAEELGVDIQQVEGTGADGKVTKQDVAAHAEAHPGKVGATPGGYNDADWMLHYGGVPTEAQMDGYLVGIAASTNQKALVAAARKPGGMPHHISISKVKDILTNNA
jgi:pyruvate/2-oxoglutarate dehydrogenase complex dihydrolipoamide acyltransferase (E2) component